MKLSIISSILLLCLVLIGCKAKKEINWSWECSQRFPTQTVYIPGEEKTVWDTIHEPGLIIQADPILLKVKCPDNLIIKGKTSRVDTFRTPDKAKEAYLQGQIKASENILKAKEQELQTERTKRQTAEEQAQKSNRQRNYCIGLVLVGGLIAGRKQLASLLKIVLA